MAGGFFKGLVHRTLPIEGVQFHPESIRSDHGHAMIENFLRRCMDGAGARAAAPATAPVTAGVAAA